MNSGEPNLLVLPDSAKGLEVEIVEGRTDPVQGWISTAYNTRIKAPAAVYKWKGSLPASFAWLLYPSPGMLDKHPRIELLENVGGSGGAAFKIAFPDGSVDYVLFAHGLAGIKRFGGFESDAEIAVVRVDAAGQVTTPGFDGGTFLREARNRKR